MQNFLFEADIKDVKSTSALQAAETCQFRYAQSYFLKCWCTFKIREGNIQSFYILL